MTIRRTAKRTRGRETGSVTVEFLFAFPAFLVLFLLVLELSLMWVDRHVMKLAAFEAARAVLMTPRDDPATWCWPAQGAANTPRGDKAQSAAKRAAVLKMAMVTPPPEYFLNQVLDKVDGLVDVGSLQSILAGPGSASPTSAPIRALVRLLKGIPAAYALTHLDCRMDTGTTPGSPGDGSVYLQLTYFRPPRMPFVGGIFWAAFVVRSMNKALTNAGAGELVQFHVDPLSFHDVRADSALVSDAQKQIAKARADAQAIVAKAGTVKTTLSDLVNLAQVSPELATFLDPSLLQSAAGDAAFGGSLASVNAGIGGVATAADAAVTAAAAPLKRALDETAVATTMVVYAVPGSFRLIPMTVEVRLVPLGTPIVHNDEAWHNAQAAFLTPLTDDIYGRYSKAIAEHGLSLVDDLDAPTDSTPGNSDQPGGTP